MPIPNSSSQNLNRWDLEKVLRSIRTNAPNNKSPPRNTCRPLKTCCHKKHRSINTHQKYQMKTLKYSNTWQKKKKDG